MDITVVLIILGGVLSTIPIAWAVYRRARRNATGLVEQSDLPLGYTML